MLIYDALREDHRRLIDVCDRILSGPVEERPVDYMEFKRLLEFHKAVEQEIFYPRLLEEKSLLEIVSAYVEEHEAIEEMIEDLDEISLTDDRWLPKFRVIEENLAQHLRQKEDDIFKRCQKLISMNEAEDLGSVHKTRKMRWQSAA